MLEELHDDACQRDRAGNRKLHYDQYAALILRYMFNPIVTSLRGIQQTSELKKVQRLHDCTRASLGSLSQAAWVFDADQLRGIIGEPLDKLPRIDQNTPFDEIEARPRSAESTQAGIVRDVVVRFTGGQAVEAGLDRPMRIVEIKCKPHHKRSGKTGRGGPEQGETILIVTDILDVPAEIIALIYKHRWAIETFFRFFKHVLGCRHLLSHSPNGIEIQTYLGIIACLLIALWTGRKPTLRTYEMICFYFTGLADEEELLAHIAKLAPQS